MKSTVLLLITLGMPFAFVAGLIVAIKSPSKPTCEELYPPPVEQDKCQKLINNIIDKINLTYPHMGNR